MYVLMKMLKLIFFLLVHFYIIATHFLDLFSLKPTATQNGQNSMEFWPFLVQQG